MALQRLAVRHPDRHRGAMAIAGGYWLGALMLVAAFAALRLAVAAERRPLEEVAQPLSAVDGR